MPLRTGAGKPPFHLDGIDLAPYASVGCLSEYTVVNERSVVKIADDIPLDRAALLGCGVYTGVGAAINTAAVRPGTSCAVWGAGGIGLSVIQACVISGALSIIAIDANPAKLVLAGELGASALVDASSEDAVRAVLRLTSGRGADFVFEAIGDPSAMEQAYAATRAGGTCTIVGVGGVNQAFSLPASTFALQEKTLKGSFVGGGASTRDFLRILRWYQQGKFKLDELITKTYRLEDVQHAFDDMTAGKNARGVILF
jgi:S-(hydroxymethyl)glutathione dehydrogenase/alcohol dehydrogenase